MLFLPTGNIQNGTDISFPSGESKSKLSRHVRFFHCFHLECYDKHIFSAVLVSSAVNYSFLSRCHESEIDADKQAVISFYG